jgi:hypothetical protein
MVVMLNCLDMLEVIFITIIHVTSLLTLICVIGIYFFSSYVATLLQIVYVPHGHYRKPLMVKRQFHLISTGGLLCLLYIS